MHDGDARRVAQLHALLCERERTRNERLACNDRSHRREDQQRILQYVGCKRVERIQSGTGIAHEQRALPEVIHQEARKHEHEPCESDWSLSEMAHVGIERLGSGHGQHHGTKQHERMPAVRDRERERVPRRQGCQHFRMRDDLRYSECRDRHEPDEHDGPEGPTDTVRAEPLCREQPHEKHDRDRDDELLKRWRDHGHALDRAKHRNGWRDDAVAIQQRRAEEGEPDEPLLLLLVIPDATGLLQQQRQQRENTAFTAVVRAQNEADVLDRDDGDQRPDDQRQHADHVGRRRLHTMRAVETFLQRVQWTGANVSVHHAEGGQRQQSKLLARRGLADVVVIALGDSLVGTSHRVKGGRDRYRRRDGRRRDSRCRVGRNGTAGAHWVCSGIGCTRCRRRRRSWLRFSHT